MKTTKTSSSFCYLYRHIPFSCSCFLLLLKTLTSFLLNKNKTDVRKAARLTRVRAPTALSGALLSWQQSPHRPRVMPLGTFKEPGIKGTACISCNQLQEPQQPWCHRQVCYTGSLIPLPKRSGTCLTPAGCCALTFLLILCQGGQHPVNSNSAGAFVDAFILHFFDVRQRVHSTAEVRLPGFGVRVFLTNFIPSY